MWTLFFAAGVIYTLQNIQENTERYLAMKTRSENRLSKFSTVKVHFKVDFRPFFESLYSFLLSGILIKRFLLRPFV